FVAAAKGRDSRRSQRVDDAVVTGAAEKRRDAFLLARAGKHLGAGHWKFEPPRRGLRRVGERRRDRDGRSFGPGNPLASDRNGGRRPGACHRFPDEVATRDAGRAVCRSGHICLALPSKGRQKAYTKTSASGRRVLTDEGCKRAASVDMRSCPAPEPQQAGLSDSDEWWRSW